MTRTALAARLGVDRALILHVDDLGATLGANDAFLDLAARGFVTCGSAMVPGPWFVHLAEAVAGRPELDAHVRLGEEYGLWPVLPRSITWAPDGAAYRAVVVRLDAAGRPVEVQALWCAASGRAAPDAALARW